MYFCNVGYGADDSGACKLCDITEYNSVVSAKDSECNAKQCALGYGSPKLDTYGVSHVDHLTDDCIICPIGEFSASVDDGQCGVCPEGTEAIAEGLSSCAECAAGEYDDDNDSKTACEECPVGKYQLNTKSTSCIDCEVGKYQDNKGYDECKVCPSGTYQPNVKSISCISCPSGKSQGSQVLPVVLIVILANGLCGCRCMFNLSNCPAGKQEDTAPSYTADRTCKDCDAGTCHQ